MARGNLSTLKHFSAKWASGKTQTIRVPVALAPVLMDLARRLDKGEDIHLSQVNRPLSISGRSSSLADGSRLDLAQVIHILEEVYQTPRNNFGKAPKEKLQTAIEKLKSLVTGD